MLRRTIEHPPGCFNTIITHGDWSSDDFCGRPAISSLPSTVLSRQFSIWEMSSTSDEDYTNPRVKLGKPRRSSNRRPWGGGVKARGLHASAERVTGLGGHRPQEYPRISSRPALSSLRRCPTLVGSVALAPLAIPKISRASWPATLSLPGARAGLFRLTGRIRRDSPRELIVYPQLKASRI